uniref:Uncharacterized protein n=1 Tax=Oryza punctata TaxID=4537 RepID=A0A0E0JU25_ORYPU
MAAALRHSARRVAGGVLQATAAATVKVEQRRVLPGLITGGAGGMPPLLRSFSSAAAALQWQQVKNKLYYYPCSKYFPPQTTIISNNGKSAKRVRAQIEEKKLELFHLLYELKFGSGSKTGGERPKLEDERILRELQPYRELTETVDKYGSSPDSLCPLLTSKASPEMAWNNLCFGLVCW